MWSPDEHKMNAGWALTQVSSDSSLSSWRGAKVMLNDNNLVPCVPALPLRALPLPRLRSANAPRRWSSRSAPSQELDTPSTRRCQNVKSPRGVIRLKG